LDKNFSPQTFSTHQEKWLSSYKFKGAFEANGIFDSTASVIDMKEDDVEPIISRIITKYENTNLPIR